MSRIYGNLSSLLQFFLLSCFPSSDSSNSLQLIIDCYANVNAQIIHMKNERPEDETQNAGSVHPTTQLTSQGECLQLGEISISKIHYRTLSPVSCSWPQSVSEEIRLARLGNRFNNAPRFYTRHTYCTVMDWTKWHLYMTPSQFPKKLSSLVYLLHSSNITSHVSNQNISLQLKLTKFCLKTRKDSNGTVI